jgi:hypothetical protein
MLLRQAFGAVLLAICQFAFSTASIGVSGGGFHIQAGAANPVTSNNTDLGDVYIGNGNTALNETRVEFLVFNLGNQNLLLDNIAPITFTGTNAAEFSYGYSNDFDTVVPPGGQIRFQAQIHPLSAGLRTATMNIHSNDPIAPNFTVALQAHAINQPTPVLPDLYLLGPQFTVKAGTKNGTPVYKLKGYVPVVGNSQATTSPATWEAHLSSDPFLDPGDVQIGSKFMKTKVSTSPKKLAIKFTSAVPTDGKYIILRIDVLNERRELFEGNNTLTFPTPPAAL